jgi:hypothetical protein
MQLSLAMIALTALKMGAASFFKSSISLAIMGKY